MFGYAPEGSGWALFFTGIPGADAPFTAMRFASTPEPGRAEDPAAPLGYDIVELLVAHTEGVTGRALRALPLGQIEAAVNQAKNHDTLERYAKTGQRGIGVTFDSNLSSMTAPERARRRRPRMAVRIPEGAKKPDSFYEQIAERYGWLQGEGVKSPAEEIAEANGVPTTTVHRWVKEARRRGLMPGGQRTTRKGSS